MGTPKHYSHNGLAGCVSQRRSRQTKTLVGIYRAEQAGLDSDPELPWVTVCEEHSTMVSHPTLEVARGHASDPRGWCEECRGPEQDNGQLP